MPSPTEDAERRALALLAAASLVLAAVDHLMPKPVPFVRLGLANLPILVALRRFSSREVVALASIKIVGQSVVTGMLFSYVFLFSAAGTITSVAAMIGIDRLLGRRISLVGVSVIGAFASNIAQITLAALLIFGPNAIVFAPPILVVGLSASIVLGIVANRFVAGSRWLARLADPGDPIV